MFEKAKERAASAANAASAAKANIKEQGQAILATGVNTALEAVSSTKDAAKNTAVVATHLAIDKALDGPVSKILNRALGSDPDMPRVVKYGIQVSVAEVIGEMKVSIKETMELKIKGQDARVQALIEAEPNRCCSPNPCSWLRANILYTLFPHDKSIWLQMKSPSWWFLKILTVFPYYFVAMSFWFVLWLLRSKRDQYQLVSFIVSMKKAHFISYGIMGSVLGNIAFIQCAMVNSDSTPCASHAPGLHLPFWPTAVQFALQIVLTWVSIALLPWSKKLGDRRNIDSRTSTFGNLKYWLFYDTVCNVALVAIMVWAVIDTKAVEAGPESIPSMMQFAVWWCRILYGWMCLPWMFLQGFLYPLILHIKPTAYNAVGHCVPTANSKEKARARERKKNKGNKVAHDPNFLPGV